MKRKTFEECFKKRWCIADKYFNGILTPEDFRHPYGDDYQRGVENGFHANDEYMDYQEKRIAELESKLKISMKTTIESIESIFELERQNALYKKCVDKCIGAIDYYESLGLEKINGDPEYFILQDLIKVRETQRMIDEVSRNY